MTTRTPKIPSAQVLDHITNHMTYNPDTGILYNKGRPIGTKRKKDNCVIFNVVIGKTAEGYSIHYTGYLPQVAWYLTHGAWPDKWIDHIDSDRSNNKLNNLRLATPSQNSHNQRKLLTKITSSRYKGVTLEKGKWRAYINNSTIGRYDTEEEAALAYDTKAREVFGVYAKLNFGDNSAVSGEMRQLSLPWG